MAGSPLEKSVPWCTVILCGLCMTSHIMVFTGNVSAAGGIASIGSSTKGWSNLGLDMASTFSLEIDNAMSNMTDQLTNSISQVVALQQALDTVLGTVGEETDQAIAKLSMLQTNDSADGGANDEAVKKVLGQVESTLDTHLAEVETMLDTLLDLVEPALMKVGEWYVSFGDKIQAGIEQFGTTVDTVEKMMDQMMAQAGMGGENAEYMEENTYTLFAITDKEKGIMVQDLQDVSSIYSITALMGSKAEDVHLKYDTNQDAVIDTTEFSELVTDASVPGVMAMVLRSYAKRLAQVSGQVANAYLRDEVAAGVVRYLQLVAAKNMTKVGWISETLTNGTLPIEFTADIMKNLAQLADDPEALTTSDVGATVIGTMSSLNHAYTIQAQELLADADFWASEGFDPADQPAIVDRVSQWTAASLLQTGSWEAFRSLRSAFAAPEGEEEQEVHGRRQLQLLQEGQGEALGLAKATGKLARRRAERSRRSRQQRRHDELLERYEKLTHSHTASHLYDVLLGGEMAFHDDPATTMAVNSGVPAKPETIQFAAWLAANASRVAGEFQSACFNYSGMSSTPIDSFATQIQGMVKKTQSVLAMLKPYAGEQGVNRLRNKSQDFIDNAKPEILDIIAQTGEAISGAGGSAPVASLLQRLGGPGRQAPSVPNFAAARQVPPAPPAGVVAEMVQMLQTLQVVLPDVVNNLKAARKGVSMVSKTLDSVFDTFRKQGLPIFQQLASIYTYVWLAWFILLSTFTLGILFYGFWASGYFGGPKGPEPPEEQDEYVPPETFGDRLRCLCRSCCSAMCCECCPKSCVFWSLLLLGQVFVLVIFIMALVLTLIAGVEMFLSSGCSGIYLLGDEKSCTETMKMMQGFLTTFTAGGPDLPIEDVCVRRDLMTCYLVGTKMKTAAMLCVVGAFTAAVFSFQLLIESAVLFERAQSRRLVDALLKEKGKAASSSA